MAVDGTCCCFRGCEHNPIRTGLVWSLEVMHLLGDFGFQVLLVGQDVSVPLGDGLVLAHPDLLSHLGEDKETGRG